MRRSRRVSAPRAGITMLELMIASVIGIVIMLALGNIDATRVYLTNQIRSSSTSLSDASFAVSLAIRDIQQADRVVVLNPTSLQVRIPLPAAATDLDNPANYKWVEYQYDDVAREIILYDPATSCTVRQRFGRCTANDAVCFSGLNIRYGNESPAPPGGDPNGPSLNPPDDNNTLQFTISWTDSKTNVTQSLTNQATMRASAYTNLPDPGLLNGGTTPNGC